MYRHNQKQLHFVEFALPFGGNLSADNRWVKLAGLIPWDRIEVLYCSTLAGSGQGAPAISVRMALAALIIKEKLGLSDEECVEQIRENPYLQYFCGLKQFTPEAPFHPTMFVHFRKRFSADVLKEINEQLIEKATERSRNKPDDDEPGGGRGSSCSEPSNRGKLLVDATCAPADITFPTDLKLLNRAREKSEQIIDTLHKSRGQGAKKPRTYRQKARKQFLVVAKSKRLDERKLRGAIRGQLGYLGRNLNSIDKLARHTGLLVLSRRQYRDLLVIGEVYRQQEWMHAHRERRIEDRIVSIGQPHVRPIKRGKAGAATEFGAKLSVSLVDGFGFVDRIDWNNFNESTDLIGQIETYRERFGFYPESVHADKIYRTRENLRFCSHHGIRLSGPRLGRPSKITEENSDALKQQARQMRQDEIDRIPIEGKFGQAKRRYGLGRLLTKLASTSETAIVLTFLVMNLEKWLAAILFYFFFKERYSNRLDDIRSWLAGLSQRSLHIQTA